MYVSKVSNKIKSLDVFIQNKFWKGWKKIDFHSDNHEIKIVFSSVVFITDSGVLWVEIIVIQCVYSLELEKFSHSK